MFVYNVQTSGNQFGFEDKNSRSFEKSRILSPAFERVRSKESKCLKKKLTSKNITFLKQLGFSVKKKTIKNSKNE